MSYGDVALGVECAIPNAFTGPIKSGFRKKLFLALAALIAATGAWQLGQGLYIHAKAQLAQVLLERAWQRT